jgi:hypothetical protein
MGIPDFQTWINGKTPFSPGPPVSPTNKTDRHDITEILLKVSLSTKLQTNKQTILFCYYILAMHLSLS